MIWLIFIFYRCFKEEDAADVLISGFTNPKQAVFEVTVTPTVDEEPEHHEDVFDSSELKIVKKKGTIAEETYSNIPEEDFDCKEKSKRFLILFLLTKPSIQIYIL